MTSIDPQSWQVTILPLPKPFSRGAAHGFCGGYPVGRAETARAISVGCWWPRGEPELLALAGHKEVDAGRACGDAIPGHWRNSLTGAMGAVVWSLHGGHPVGTELHDPAYETTWATGSGGGAIVGSASPRRTPGKRSLKIGLMWREGAETTVVTGAGDVSLFATNGTRLAGSIDARATFWPTATATPVDLAPSTMPLSEVQALDDELQIGVAWKGMCARAALWRGTASSFCDLTPEGFASARAFGGTRGFQVGFVRSKDTTRDGSAGSDNRAVLWQGAADRWLDLNALLPNEMYNASVAWAIEIHGDELRVCGEASRYEVSNPGTAQESHFVPLAHPVLWTARLSAHS